MIGRKIRSKISLLKINRLIGRVSGQSCTRSKFREGVGGWSQKTVRERASRCRENGENVQPGVC